MDTHATEVSRGERFEFGKNWRKFLSVLSEPRIKDAETSLRSMLGIDHLRGKSFLDIGSGSGLTSLAAIRLGAARVHSFDYDPHSVACTKELRRYFSPEGATWTIEEGSALDADYLRSLGQFSIVCSWGVLHHTGQLWAGLANAILPVAEGGKLYIAIYNDAGSKSKRWRAIKKSYNKLPNIVRPFFVVAVMAPMETKRALSALVSLNIGEYVRSWTSYTNRRGMSRWHDYVDWVGGFPYEVANPDEVFDFYHARGFTLTKLKCGGVGTGCNEFVFSRCEEVQSALPDALPSCAHLDASHLDR